MKDGKQSNYLSSIIRKWYLWRSNKNYQKFEIYSKLSFCTSYLIMTPRKKNENFIYKIPSFLKFLYELKKFFSKNLLIVPLRKKSFSLKGVQKDRIWYFKIINAFNGLYSCLNLSHPSLDLVYSFFNHYYL